MTDFEIKVLISQSHLQPVRLYMDDGRSFGISHPDFAMAVDRWIFLSDGPNHDLGGDRVVALPLEHVSGIHISKKKRRAA